MQLYNIIRLLIKFKKKLNLILQLSVLINRIIMATQVMYSEPVQEELSLYIPRINVNYTEEDIKYTFRLLFIGDVERVDFVELDGSYQRNPNSTYKSAFVHMDCYYASILANGIYNVLNNKRGNRCYKLNVSDNEYWLLKPNLRPVKYTDLNIHQIVENFTILENKVKELESELVKWNSNDTIYTSQIDSTYRINVFDDGNEKYQKFDNKWKKIRKINELPGKVSIKNISSNNVINSISSWKLEQIP